MYFFRIQDAIRESFPAVAAAFDGVGESALRDLVVAFLARHPSRHFSLREIGGPLEAFLGEPANRERVPYAADLAAFEWAFLGAFDAADADAVAAADMLAGIPADRWAELRFVFSPSLRSVALGFAVAPTWERVGKGEPFEAPAPVATRYRLWRREQQVFYRAIEETERVALAAAERGTFGDVCAAIADRVGDESAPGEAFAILSRWIHDGIVVRIEG
ncbi:MAG: HvfC/BufC family peptide modification chaperone, partial [Candidatus Binatia bacterium]